MNEPLPDPDAPPPPTTLWYLVTGLRLAMLSVYILTPIWFAAHIYQVRERFPYVPEAQIGFMMFSVPMCALLLLFGAILMERLPKHLIELLIVLLGPVLLLALHGPVMQSASVELFFGAVATYSATLFIAAFIVELVLRAVQVVVKDTDADRWEMAGWDIAASVACLVLFVIPGLNVIVLFFRVLFGEGLFTGRFYTHLPFWLAFGFAAFAEWRALHKAMEA